MSEWMNIWVKDFAVSFFGENRFWNKEYLISGLFGSELVKGEFPDLMPHKLRNQILFNNKGFFEKIRGKYRHDPDAANDHYPDIFSEDFKKHMPQAGHMAPGL